MIAVASVVLMLPALINGSVLLYPDSVGYYNAGEASLESAARLIGRSSVAASEHGQAMRPPASVEQRSDDGISTSRSVFFGMPMVLLYLAGGGWALPIAMVVVTMACLMNALPLLARTSFAQTVVAIALFGLLAGLAVVADTALPDLFAGLMILSMAVMFSFWSRLSPTARVAWIVLLLASCLFHKSNTAVAAVMIFAYFLVALADRRRLKTAGMFIGVLAIAVVGHAGVSIVVERITKRPVVDAPFLLARMIGDGTAKQFLDVHCATQQLELCHYRELMPMTENQFLWSTVPGKGVMSAIPLAARQAITAEANIVVFGTLREYTGAQFAASLQNFTKQFFLVGVSEYLVPPRPALANESGLSVFIRRYPDTAVGRGTMPLVAQSAAMKWTYIASLLVVFAVICGPRRRSFGRPLKPEVMALGWIMLGIVSNAAVSGVLAGVFDRYQGRVAWLMPLAALIAIRTAFAVPPSALGNTVSPPPGN